MQIVRVNNEILIRLSAGIDTTGLQRLLDFIKIKEIASNSLALQKQIDKLAEQSKNDWWEKNKSF